MSFDSSSCDHRRRIKTEEKAKLVASVWGEECIQFLAVQAVLLRTTLKNRINSLDPSFYIEGFKLRFRNQHFKN